MKKVLSIIGARPQFIKHQPLKKALFEHFEEKTIHTGQHYDSNMSDIFFKEMNIAKPEFNLKIGSGSHAYQTAEMMKTLESILSDENPDIVIIYGDTNSTLAGALTSAKMQIKIAHIEAGMRSFNRDMPEEINRIIADRLSQFNFAPTLNAMNNLKKEGMTGILTGDIMYDAFKHFSNLSLNNINMNSAININEEFILLTLHRAYNTTPDNIKLILSRLNNLNKRIVFPIHPRTRAVMKDNHIERHYSNIEFTEPLGYRDMLLCLKNCSYVITDSGGLQKEAYYAKKKCITIRSETEWTETIDHGANILCPLGECEIDEFISNTKPDFDEIYGSGNAASIIVKKLLESL